MSVAPTRIGPFARSSREAPVDDSDLDVLVALAASITRTVGEHLVAGRHGVDVAATKSSYRDVVTAMDREAEALVVDAIRTSRPNDGIAGEEGSAHPSESGLWWHVDPIDGTVNYLYGLPEWAVSVGVTRDATPVVGVVAVPMQRELYIAVRGRGAHLVTDRGQHVALRANDPVELPQALVATGFAYETERRVMQAEVVRRLVPAVRDVRRGGSCAVDLCSVAAGRVDGYYEVGPNAWDYAAGGLIAAEAGATVEVVDLGDGPLVIAAGPTLYGRLFDAVSSGAVR